MSLKIRVTRYISTLHKLVQIMGIIQSQKKEWFVCLIYVMLVREKNPIGC